MDVTYLWVFVWYVCLCYMLVRISLLSLSLCPKLLLCDVCNNECHMYCQYPVLWSVPEGMWVCPFCSEVSLFGMAGAADKGMG